MTTKTPKRDATAELAALEAAVGEAVADAGALADRHAAAAAEVDRLRAQRLHLQVQEPGQFLDDGPAPGSDAERLTAELVQAVEAVERGDWHARRAAADERVRIARHAMERHRAEHARELIAALEPEAEAAVAAFNDWAGKGTVLVERLASVGHRASAICVQSRVGDPRSVPSLDHVSRLTADLAQAAVPLPLPRIEDA